MPCLITSGYSLQCRDNIGGVQNVYIGTFNGSSLTYTVSGTNSQITAFGGATTSFYTFNQPLETASFEQAGNWYKFLHSNSKYNFTKTNLNLSLISERIRTRNLEGYSIRSKWNLLVDRCSKWCESISSNT